MSNTPPTLATLSRDGFIGLDRLTAAVQHEPSAVPRDAAQRDRYAHAGLASIPRILGAIDRHPYRASYGCLDRAWWHYRTSDFASAMYQEALWPLALVYSHQMPGNRWYQHPRVKDLVVAGLRFSANSSHADASCDDYYPFERALGAAAFATNAAAQAYLLLSLDDPELRAWFERRADWMTAHQESGRLANHQALAALALARVSLITGCDRHREAARSRLGLALAWQCDEGWFDEYGGADPGYQTVTLDCLAAYRNLTGATWLNPAIERGLRFARHFLHPDSSYGGEYGSRGTYHFYPHGMELLAAQFADAADLADGYLASLAQGTHAHFDDDRMFAHYTGNLLEAWLDWSPERPTAATKEQAADACFPQAGLSIHTRGQCRTIVSTSRGGIFKHFDATHRPTTDAGLVVEFADGRVAVSQMQDRTQPATYDNPQQPTSIDITRALHLSSDETFTPARFLLFRLFMLLCGRWCGQWVRKRLQRRAITGRRPAPVRLARRIEFCTSPDGAPHVRVTDTIELTDRRLKVKRMALGVDHQSVYVAACGVYQDAVLQPWTDLQSHIDQLNRAGRVTIVREL